MADDRKRRISVWEKLRHGGALYEPSVQKSLCGLSGMADTRWVEKANALSQAWKNVGGSFPPNKSIVLIALAQAQLETSAGDAWPLAHNWGAVDYRAVNAKELAAIDAGTLKDGSWLFPDGSWSADHRPEAVGILHSDSHPTPSGPSWFHVWFGAFPDDVAGAGNFLHTIFRMVSKEKLADPNLDAVGYATEIYLHCYFEGTVAGARPCGKRSIPLTPPEMANVNNYAKIITRIVAGLQSALKDWDVPLPIPVPIPPKPDPAPTPAPDPAPAPTPEPAPAPPEPAPDPAPAPSPTPPAPIAHRPLVAWLGALGVAVMAFGKEHPAYVAVAIIIVLIVVADVAVHFKKKTSS